MACETKNQILFEYSHIYWISALSVSPNSLLYLQNSLLFASWLSLKAHNSRHNLRIRYWELSIIQWSNIQMSEGTTSVDISFQGRKGKVNFYFYYSKKIDGKVSENNWLKLGLGDSLWFHFLTIFLYPTGLSKPQIGL